MFNKKLKSYTRLDAKVGDTIIIRGPYCKISTVEKITPKQFVAGGVRFDADGIEITTGYSRLSTYFYDEEFANYLSKKQVVNKIKVFLSKNFNWYKCDDELIIKIKNCIDEYEKNKKTNSAQ